MTISVHETLPTPHQSSTPPPSQRGLRVGMPAASAERVADLAESLVLAVGSVVILGLFCLLAPRVQTLLKLASTRDLLYSALELLTLFVLLLQLVLGTGLLLWFRVYYALTKSSPMSQKCI